jgi:hypothetical protein
MTTVATDYEDPRDYGRAVRSALLRPLLVSKDERPQMKKARTGNYKKQNEFICFFVVVEGARRLR